MMRVLAAVAALLSPLTVAPAVQAQGRTAPPAYDRCLAAAQAPADEIACVTEETRRQDAALNRDYKLIIDDLVESEKGSDPPATFASGPMRAAQRAWIAFRDADCRLPASATWGARADLEASKCLLARTAERARDLKYEVPGAPERAPAPSTSPATAYDRCMKRAVKLDFREEQSCAFVEAEREDARLNRAYKALLARLGAQADKDAARGGQRAWIAFRDAECGRLGSDWMAGRNGGYASMLCAMGMTSTRTDQLEAFVKAHPPG